MDSVYANYLTCQVFGSITWHVKYLSIQGADMDGKPFGVVHFFAGGTKDQYEASIGAVHPSDGALPAGQIFHAAGSSTGGWTIMAVHESKESWETFRDGTLLPRMQQGIEGGFTSPPVETEIDLYNVVSG